MSISRFVFSAIFVFLFSFSTAAMDIRDGIAEQFHSVYDAIEAGDARAAERALNELRRSHGNTADYHFLDGQINMLRMNDASMVRIPFIARGMRRSWEKAVEIDPEHEVSVFSLAMFYAAAPGIVGGDKEKADAFYQRLVSLESDWQFPLHVTLLASNEADEQEVDAAFEAWFEAKPELVSARMNYVFLKNNSDERTGVHTQLQILDQLIAEDPTRATDEERAQIDYQWGKMSAESGIALAEGRDRLIALWQEQRLPENISEGFLHARLAAIYQQLEDHENAQRHFAQAKDFAKDNDGLQALLDRIES